MSDIGLIFFFEELQTVLAQFDLSWHIYVLTEERKNPDINHIGRENGSSQTLLTAQFFFVVVYILMYGREEWVLE